MDLDPAIPGQSLGQGLLEVLDPKFAALEGGNRVEDTERGQTRVVEVANRQLITGGVDALSGVPSVEGGRERGGEHATPVNDQRLGSGLGRSTVVRGTLGKLKLGAIRHTAAFHSPVGWNTPDRVRVPMVRG